MRRDDYSYFRRRVAQEEEAARHAAGPEARERHKEFADAYRLRCSLIDELLSKGAERYVDADPLARDAPEPPLYRFAGHITSDQDELRGKPEASVEIDEHA